jgi:predicted  nucleic acid-binding Zn-ribbon protein
MSDDQELEQQQAEPTFEDYLEKHCKDDEDREQAKYAKEKLKFNYKIAMKGGKDHRSWIDAVPLIEERKELRGMLGNLQKENQELRKQLERIDSKLDSGKRGSLEDQLIKLQNQYEQSIKDDDHALKNKLIDEINKVHKEYESLIDEKKEVTKELTDQEKFTAKLTEAVDGWLQENPWALPDHEQYDKERSSTLKSRIHGLVEDGKTPAQIITILERDSAKYEREKEAAKKPERKNTNHGSPAPRGVSSGGGVDPDVKKTIGKTVDKILSANKAFGRFIRKSS